MTESVGFSGLSMPINQIQHFQLQALAGHLLHGLWLLYFIFFPQLFHKLNIIVDDHNLQKPIFLYVCM